MKKKNCSCQACKDCCWNNPGWFGSISEIRGAAKLLGLATKDFCEKYLKVEYWADAEGDIFVPAPKRDFSRKKVELCSSDFMIQMESKNYDKKGFTRVSWGHNLIQGIPCIFLTAKENCLIHASKPQECREAFGCNSVNGLEHREKLLNYWKKHQDWIEKQQSEY